MDTPGYWSRANSIIMFVTMLAEFQVKFKPRPRTNKYALILMVYAMRVKRELDRMKTNMLKNSIKSEPFYPNCDD